MKSKGCLFFGNNISISSASQGLMDLKKDPSMLGKDVIIEILKHLSKDDIKNASRVSKAWLRFSSDNNVWKGILLRDKNIGYSHEYLNKIIREGKSIRNELIINGIHQHIKRLSEKLQNLSPDKTYGIPPKASFETNALESMAVVPHPSASLDGISMSLCMFIDSLFNAHKRAKMTEKKLELNEELIKYSFEVKK